MSGPLAPPDPRAKPLKSEELADDHGFADDGPVLDVGEDEIDIERREAGAPEPKSAVPPEAAPPPD